MDKECEELLEKIQSIARNASSKLHDELYPQKLGERITMQVPELRITVISKYEGMGIVLQKLGVDISKLETMIENEVDKTSAGKY